MRNVFVSVLFAVLIGIVAISASESSAATLTGCGGGDFGAGCSLQELLSGGSIETGGVRLDQWALPGNINEIPGSDLTKIEVVPIDESVATGIRYLADPGLNYTPKGSDPLAVDLKLGFRVTGLGTQQINGDELEILRHGFGDESVSAFAFLFQTDCTDGFNAPSPCVGVIPGGSPQALSDQLDPLAPLLGTGAFPLQSSFFVTLGVQLGGVEGDSVTLNSFEQRFLLHSTPNEVGPTVPEPGTLMLLGSGAASLLAVTLRRRRASHR
jgi:hypothetical protein